jgi:3-deoxy-7-phosphoheptulonate synthase
MMIIIMEPQATMGEKSAVIGWAEDAGQQVHLSEGNERMVIGLVGNGRPVLPEQIERMPGVERVVPVTRPFKLASRDFKPNNTHFPLGNHTVGDKEIIVMAGPCSVESRSQILETAHACKEAGAHVLRVGAFKPSI